MSKTSWKTPQMLAAGLVVAGWLTLALRPAPPVQASADRKKLGAALFRESGCEHCHGVDGVGGELGPELQSIGKQWKKPQIEHQIRRGGGGMPAFDDALQPDEITALVEFLHAKKHAPKKARKSAAPAPLPAPPVAAPPAPSASPE